jgi:thioredoxin-like negative regulator of GroEL
VHVTSTTAPDAERKPLRLDDGEGFDDLRESTDLLLVEFYTNGCSMCAAMEPVLGNVARTTDATVAMVNAGYAFDLAERYAVSSVPTLLLFEDGDLVGRLADGFQGADAVLSFVEAERSE